MTEQATGWDEATRPTFPVPEGVTYTPRQRAAPQHLVDVHDALRAELEQLRDIVGQVADGTLDVGPARSAISRMTVRQNNWTLGAYCAQYCRVVTGRLEVEHEVIADLLERVDGALVALVLQDGAVDPVAGRRRAAR